MTDKKLVIKIKKLIPDIKHDDAMKLMDGYGWGYDEGYADGIESEGDI